MSLQHTIIASVRRGETHYVAECLELPVVTQGDDGDDDSQPCSGEVETWTL